jgi:hypothetical protein
MSSKKKQILPEIMYNTIQLSVKFGHVILPFDIIYLENRLLSLGYNVEKERITPPGAAVGRQRLGTMEDMEVIYNNDRQVLTVKGQNPDKVVKGFELLYDSISELASPIKLNVSFYETIVSAIVKGSKNPLTVFSKVGYTPNQKEFETLFGQKVSPFGIRLCPSNAEIDSPNWFEYRIEPFTIQPSLVYLSAYIYRNQSMSKTIESISLFNDVTSKSVALVEA